MRRQCVEVAWCLAVMMAPAAARAQAAPFRGTVVDDATNRPIAGAEIVLGAPERVARTDSAGAFSMPGVTDGRYSILVRRLGYAPLRTTITIKARDSLAYDFTLVAAPESLAPVEVKATTARSLRLEDFESNRKMGFGDFLTADDLEKKKNQTMGEILRRVRGASVTYGPTAQAYAASLRGGSRCLATVFLDGAIVYGLPGQLRFDVNSLRPDDLLGVEFYSGIATPERFRGMARNGCGVLVIWTK